MPPSPEVQKAEIPPGVCAVTTFGVIRQETVTSLLETRSFSEKQGLVNVQWIQFPGTLVEKARNDACRHLLRNPAAQWLLFMDADMVWAPDNLLQMLQTAYVVAPAIDVLGAYCPLRGDLALPTIDTGTGMWESGWFPGQGPIDVMRTGAAFLLIKRHVLEALKDPWFRIRPQNRPIHFMAEVDNFARIKFDGKNPFRDLPNHAWERLEQCAVDDPSIVAEQFIPIEVGEDSGFCDRAKNAGFRIAVQTDIAIGHVDTRVLSWQHHKEALDKIATQALQCCGVWT